MARLPVLSGREVVRVFESFGWCRARQSGSHIVLIKAGHIASLRGTLRTLIRSAGLTVDEFVAAIQ